MHARVSAGERPAHDADPGTSGADLGLDEIVARVRRGAALTALVAGASGCLAASRALLSPPASRALPIPTSEGVGAAHPLGTSLPLRGGYSDSDAEVDDSDLDDFEVGEDEEDALRQIKAELDSSKGGRVSSHSPAGGEDDMLTKLKTLSDPSKRTEPYPWEGVSTKWMSDPSRSAVLPPEDRDGHQYLLTVRRDDLTGEELGGTLDIELRKGRGKVDAAELHAKYKDKLQVQTSFRPDKLREMTYSQFWTLVEEGHVHKARFSHDRRNIYVTTKASAPGGVRTEQVGLPPDPRLMDHLLAHGVFVHEPRDLSALEDWLLGAMRIGIPVCVGMALLYASTKIGLLAEDASSSFEVVQPSEINASFKDVAGIDVIKSEVVEVVSFLRQPKRFLEMGIRTPAGVLLVGQPGTGKTLLARAVAAEADVPLINCSGAEFVDEYVGMGAAKVRDLFELAREKAPCVIFVDEFDGIGKQRSGGAGSEDMHTCNQLLAEMDGFTNNTGVVVLAATNRAFVLDKAVLRPGRFDRVLEMPLPNREGRIAVLEVHSRGKRLAKDVDLAVIARATPGFTGAELMNLMNQSGLTAIRKGRDVVTQADVFESLDEIQAERLGEESPFTAQQLSGAVPAELKKRTATFAAAKALVGCVLPGYHELARVSVCPTGLASTFAHFVPREESVETNVVDRAVLEAELVVLMAGFCAEKLTFGVGNVSVLGSADVEAAGALARQMVCEYGYGARVGILPLPTETAEAAGEAGGKISLSKETLSQVDADVADLLKAAETKAYYGLARNWRLYEKLSNKLFEEESILGGDFADVVRQSDPFTFPALTGEGAGVGFALGEAAELRYPDHSDLASAARGRAEAEAPARE